MEIHETLDLKDYSYIDEYVDENDVDSYLHVVVTHLDIARPAPACSNPSSPAYSDPGDDGYVEYELYIKNDKTKTCIKIDDKDPLYENDSLFNKIYNEMEELYLPSH